LKKIWLIGGTKDSADIAKAIAEAQIPSIVTVTTASAKDLYPANFPLGIGCFSTEAMKDFCYQKNIIAIVDASHPFATEVSQNAIATARNQNIPYLRYERHSCQLSKLSNSNQFLTLDSFETLLNGDYLHTLFTRVLPKVNSVQIALDSGFTSDRMIAIRPPISAEFETVLWQKWHISLVVTKASGKPGGEDIKHKVAINLGIGLITIARPKIFYPQQTSCIKKIMAFCQQYNPNNLT